jgi:hypothetical protein
MEGFSLMALENRIKDELNSVYRVPKDLCEAYDQVYNKEILPLIEEKFLAHLVSAVEDLIFEKIRTKNPKAPRYRIILWKNNPKNGKATMRPLPFGAIIAYNSQNHYRDLRVFVAHELGHLLTWYKVLDGDSTENNANLFTYFAINGKNTFYRDTAPSLVYRGGELEIISGIQAVCPITKENQIRSAGWGQVIKQ